jgi:hypothetical protein
MVDDYEFFSEVWSPHFGDKAYYKQDNAPFIFSQFVSMGYQVRMGYLRGG